MVFDFFTMDIYYIKNLQQYTQMRKRRIKAKKYSGYGTERKLYRDFLRPKYLP
jgi:hypothetical protein